MPINREEADNSSVKTKQHTSNSVRCKRRGGRANQRQDGSRRCERDEDESGCIMCGERYADSRPGEQWIQCMKCSQWCHDDRTGGETSSEFTCDFCN